MADDKVQTALLYHFCRLRLPSIALPLAAFEQHLRRAFHMHHDKETRRQGDKETGREADKETGRQGDRQTRREDDDPSPCLPVSLSPGLGQQEWGKFLENLYPLDLFLAGACLEGQQRAWEELFAARAARTDTLLVDALRQRAVRLFPRDPERQDEAVAEFWGYLLAGGGGTGKRHSVNGGSPSILARYDGQRPLVPWLIRVFQNKHLSELRHRHLERAASDDELDARLLAPPSDGSERWHEEFRCAARDWLATLAESELLILGLRLRYRLSQREVAALLGIHEGNVSRHTDRLRERCLEEIGARLQEQGWTGEDLGDFVYKEMDTLLLDEPRLAADRLAALLAARGKKTPPAIRAQEPGMS